MCAGLFRDLHFFVSFSLDWGDFRKDQGQRHLYSAKLKLGILLFKFTSNTQLCSLQKLIQYRENQSLFTSPFCPRDFPEELLSAVWHVSFQIFFFEFTRVWVHACMYIFSVYIHIYAFRNGMFMSVFHFFSKEQKSVCVCCFVAFLHLTFLGEVSMSSRREPPLGVGVGESQRVFCKADKQFT